MAETISVFVPLLFLVVTELSSIAREIDLKNTVKQKSSPFVLGFAPRFVEELNKFLNVPKLGHFNFIHGANFILLALGMFLVVSISSGTTMYVLVAMVWIIWSLLPIFEVDKYQAILNTKKPFSFAIHVATTSICAAFIVVVVLELNQEAINETFVLGVRLFDWLWLIFWWLVLVSNQQFLTHLEKEIDNIPSDDENSESG
jgi:hypothetical protein